MIQIDPLSTLVLLLIAFLAWSQGMDWLFYIMLLIAIITAKSLSLLVVVVFSIGILWYFELKQYWFVALFVIMGVVLILAERKKKTGGEFYSPELMKLLGG